MAIHDFTIVARQAHQYKIANIVKAPLLVIVVQPSIQQQTCAICYGRAAISRIKIDNFARGRMDDFVIVHFVSPLLNFPFSTSSGAFLNVH